MIHPDTMTVAETKADASVETTAAQHGGRCPFSSVAQEFNPFADSYQNDPYDFYRRARQEEPVFYSPKFDAWIVTRYADVSAVLRDSKNFIKPGFGISRLPIVPEAKAILDAEYHFVPTFADDDSGLHRQLRSWLAKALHSPRFAASVYEPKIRALTVESIADFDFSEPVDLVRELAIPVSIGISLQLLGVPEEYSDRIMEWNVNFQRFIGGRLDSTEQVAGARILAAHWAFCVQHVAQMRQNLGDDLTSELLRFSERCVPPIATRQIESTIFALSFATSFNTIIVLVNGLRILLSRPEIWQALHRNPDLIPNVVEEILRFDSSVPVIPLIATSENAIGGVKIPVGATVLLSLSSSGRDENVFEQPDEFDIHRKNARKHLAFSAGLHVCVGARFARLELQTVLRLLTSCFPHMRLVAGQHFEWTKNMFWRDLQKLLVEVDAR